MEADANINITVLYIYSVPSSKCVKVKTLMDPAAVSKETILSSTRPDWFSQEQGLCNPVQDSNKLVDKATPQEKPSKAILTRNLPVKYDDKHRSY